MVKGNPAPPTQPSAPQETEGFCDGYYRALEAQRGLAYAFEVARDDIQKLRAAQAAPRIPAQPSALSMVAEKWRMEGMKYRQWIKECPTDPRATNREWLLGAIYKEICADELDSALVADEIAN